MRLAIRKRVITRAELARHTSKHDAWISVHGVVLDVTKFKEEHPGGESILMLHVGTEKFLMVKNNGRKNRLNMLPLRSVPRDSHHFDAFFIKLNTPTATAATVAVAKMI
mmetsp:Transcript_18545/g.18374  ORF Transcript_18545/g.18374 Transcript_18545/m.18374 type:complete len:109 (+) Transcript_18545:3-329(+)